MFEPSWGRNPRCARTFSRPGRGSTSKGSSWRTFKMPLHRLATSRRASHAIRKRSRMHQSRWTVYGIRHYLSPSDMGLHPGNVQGYNNEVAIAGSDAAIGHNPGINELELIGTGAGTTGGKIAPPAGTVHRGPQADVPSAVPEEHVSSGTKTAPSSGAEQQQRRNRRRPKKQKRWSSLPLEWHSA